MSRSEVVLTQLRDIKALLILQLLTSGISKKQITVALKTKF